jgi:hypothetical protein
MEKTRTDQASQPATAVRKFCRCQLKCKEDTPQTWTCCAHLAEGRAEQCHFGEDMIKTIKHTDADGKQRERRIMSSRGEGLGQCVDWEPVP